MSEEISRIALSRKGRGQLNEVMSCPSIPNNTQYPQSRKWDSALDETADQKHSQASSPAHRTSTVLNVSLDKVCSPT